MVTRNAMEIWRWMGITQPQLQLISLPLPSLNSPGVIRSVRTNENTEADTSVETRLATLHGNYYCHNYTNLKLFIYCSLFIWKYPPRSKLTSWKNIYIKYYDIFCGRKFLRMEGKKERTIEQSEKGDH